MIVITRAQSLNEKMTLVGVETVDEYTGRAEAALLTSCKSRNVHRCTFCLGQMPPGSDIFRPVGNVSWRFLRWCSECIRAQVKISSEERG